MTVQKIVPWCLVLIRHKQGPQPAQAQPLPLGPPTARAPGRRLTKTPVVKYELCAGEQHAGAVETAWMQRQAPLSESRPGLMSKSGLSLQDLKVSFSFI